jgi:aldose 1-epimerase
MIDEIAFYKLKNHQVEVVIANYGCTVVSIFTPDKNNVLKNIVAGFNDPSQYLTNHPYTGAAVGRFANRIAFGKFVIDGKQYQLPLNNEANHLHGGINGFDKKFWKLEDDNDGLLFSYTSPDGEEGYPGKLILHIHFQLSSDNELIIRYNAVTDAPTIVNLTNHSYFNLTGFTKSTIHNHVLQIFADSYTVKNENNIPSGKSRSVARTAYDFRQPKAIGEDIHLMEKDMGYDINFILKNKPGEIILAAELHDSESGRLLKVFTDRPGMQLYTANWWDGSLTGDQNTPYQKHGAVALETQAFPDAPNHPNFPDAVLRPCEKYITTTIYQFLITGLGIYFDNN